MRHPILLIIVVSALASSAYAQLAEPPAGITEGIVKEQTDACAANAPLGNLKASPSWSGWGGENNARFQTKTGAGLAAADVPKLKLKWSFGLPGGKSMYSSPAVAFGRVFIGNDNGVVYSLDAKTGCTHWAYQADMFGRFAPIAAPITGHAGTRYAIFFVTRSTTAYALDAQNGKLLWKQQIRTGLNNLSATAAFHNGRLYVPMSGTETLVGGDLNYECCKSRGAVAALDANTGKVLWVTQTVQEPLRELGENAKGKQRFGPAGASVWNTPTIDAKRGLVYAGTGNSFGRIASAYSDSIIALRMTDGKMMWHHQEFEGDAFMARCQPNNPVDANCAEKLGPDYDFGGSSAILQTVAGKDIVLAAGKGGVAIALDPDNEGKLLWRTQLWENTAPSASGLVVWGGAADGTRVYYPLQQPGGGLKALDIKTGQVEWNAAIEADRRGQAGPASAIPGVVFTGGWDGILRAVGADGKVIWSFNAVRDFTTTVNGVAAKGGSFGSAGPVVAGGMLFAASGYPGTLRGTPGNVLLAFGVE
jgi:polyvinyl alcohol dehydrogenase (cytochrome)